MIKKTPLNQACGKDSEYIIGGFQKSFSIDKSVDDNCCDWLERG